MTNGNKNNTQDSEINKSGSRSQGVARLTIDAVLAITDIVESVHHRISPLSSLTSKNDKEKVSGISGLVYQNIRNVTEQIGDSIDAPLASISKTMDTASDSASKQALQAALNGVLGDHLVRSGNPLAIPMHFRKGGKTLNEAQLRDLVATSNGKIMIMVHGLCMNDLQWRREGHDHGAELANDIGMQAIYLHYNTGRHISDNGQDFAILLASLHKLSDHILDINILAHSMGGLVSRSALHQTKNLDYKGSPLVNNLIFLGTPHHGAALEKAGNWIDMLLGAHSYTAPFGRLVKVRSAGISDLRFGNVQQADWESTDRFEFIADQRLPMALPTNVKCFAIATSAKENENHALGDGLVSIKSALGEHENRAFNLLIPDERKWVGNKINHLQLLSDKRVYEMLKVWLEMS